MEITFDAASHSEMTGASGAWEHIVGTGSDRLLVVGVSIQGTVHTVSDITWGSQSLTYLATKLADNGRIELWYLKSPDSGTKDITVTISGEGYSSVGATSWAGVHQTTPFGTVASANGESTGPTVDVSSGIGELVLDLVGDWYADTTFTVGADQNERWKHAQTWGPYTAGAACSSEPGDTTVTMSWTLSNLTYWASMGVPLKPAAPRVSRRPGMGFMFVEEPELLMG